MNPDAKSISPSFGDNVRILATSETEAKGIAGLVGQVFGETTPSVTGVEVIGELASDYAVNVFFEEAHESFWFAPALLEFMDHAPGTEITVGGVPKKWVRNESGQWCEESLDQSTKRSWWQFWK